MPRVVHAPAPILPLSASLPLRGEKDRRLTWEETYLETAREKEDWSDLDATLAHGIEPGEKW